jgi:hypothetical protein
MMQETIHPGIIAACEVASALRRSEKPSPSSLDSVKDSKMPPPAPKSALQNPDIAEISDILAFSAPLKRITSNKNKNISLE